MTKAPRAAKAVRPPAKQPRVIDLLPIGGTAALWLDRLMCEVGAWEASNKPFMLAIEWSATPGAGASLYELREVCPDGLVCAVLPQHPTLAGTLVFIPLASIGSCSLRDMPPTDGGAP